MEKVVDRLYRTWMHGSKLRNMALRSISESGVSSPFVDLRTNQLNGAVRVRLRGAGDCDNALGYLLALLDLVELYVAARQRLDLGDSSSVRADHGADTSFVCGHL